MTNSLVRQHVESVSELSMEANFVKAACYIFIIAEQLDSLVGFKGSGS